MAGRFDSRKRELEGRQQGEPQLLTFLRGLQETMAKSRSGGGGADIISPAMAQGTGGEGAGAGEKLESSLDKVREKALGEVAKAVGSQAVEALQMSNDPAKVISNLDRLLPASMSGARPAQEQEAQQGMSQMGQAPQQPQQDFSPIDLTNRLNPLQQLLSLGGKLIGPSTRNRILQNIALEQQIKGEVPLQQGEKQKLESNLLSDLLGEEGKFAMEKFKQDRLDERERIKASLKEDGVDDSTATAQIASNDLTDMVKSWDDLSFMKGAIGGRAEQLIATGFGSERLAKFEAMAEPLIFSLAEYVTGQKGRAITEKDLERLSKAFKFKVTDRRNTFVGKLQSVVNFMNNRIKAGNKQGDLLPNAKEILRRVRAGIDPLAGTSTQSQPSKSKGLNVEIIEQISE